MATATKKKPTPKGDLSFKGHVSDLPYEAKQEVDLAQQLFDQREVKEKIDSFEAAMGRRPADNEKAPKVTTKNIILNLDNEKDSKLLNDIMNNKDKYSIIKWNDNWDKAGRFKVFLIYEKYGEDEPADQDLQ